jgi:hypothetical protein
MFSACLQYTRVMHDRPGTLRTLEELGMTKEEAKEKGYRPLNRHERRKLDALRKAAIKEAGRKKTLDVLAASRKNGHICAKCEAPWFRDIGCGCR